MNIDNNLANREINHILKKEESNWEENNEILEISNRIEALLFTRDNGLKVKDISQALNITKWEADRGLFFLQRRYENTAISLTETASGWRLQVKSKYFADLSALAEIKPPHYSNAFWETLAFIAYNQPVSRAEIDKARGVSTSSGIYRQLFDLEWIKVIGHRELPGRPELLATTQTFLDDFSLKSTEDLPFVAKI